MARTSVTEPVGRTFRLAGDDPEALRRLQQRGAQLANEGRPSAAERVLRTALDSMAGRLLNQETALVAARLLNTFASVDFQLAGFEPAMARLDDAAELVGRYGLAQARTAVHVQRGNLFLRVGRYADALGEYDSGDAVAAAAPVSDRCSLLLNRAVAHLDLRSVAAARADLTRCRDEAHAAGLERVELKATHNLGWVEFLSGNLPRALELMDRAAATDPTVAPGIALLGKAQVLVEAGLFREADATLLAAARTFRRERVFRDLAETELERARCALAVGDYQGARRLAAAARRRFARQRVDSLRHAADLLLVQTDVLRQRVTPRSLADARRVLDEVSADGLRLPMRLGALIAAEAHLAAGDVEEAATLLASAGPARRDDPITGRMHSHYVRARVDAAHGHAAAASRRIRRALDELARYQASFGSIDLRTASAVHGRRLAETDIGLALQSGRAPSVFAAAERARAVSSRLPAVRPPDDPVTAELLAELRQLVESLRSGGRVSEPLLRKRRELERQITARSWTRSGSGTVDRPAGLDAVRAGLAAQSCAMVTYVQAAERLAAVVIAERTTLQDLGPSAPVVEQVRRVRADLDVLAQPRLPSGIRAAVRSSLERSLARLDAVLLSPVDTGGRLALVSTGALGQLPWASLPSLRGRPIVVAPSATKWLASTAAAAGGGLDVVAFAGPDLGRGDEEVSAVRAAWRSGRSLTGARATTSALTEAVASASVLHVAAHGVHQPENPLFSSLRMVDGPVFAHELDRHGRAPDHVILSACEVGLATIRPGDEPLGLASVLLQLGTRSVVAGVARVGDELAEQTMAAYHAKLVRGCDSSVALAEALAEVDADVTPPFVNFGAAWSTAAAAP